MATISKNDKIKNTLKETKERHSHMDCKTYEIKIVSSKLNKNQKDDINTLFKEAKWIRNAYIADKDCLKANFKEVPVSVKGQIELRALNIIGSQIKQSVIRSVQSEIKGLSTHKANGDKVGKLKFKSVCNAVDLKQYGTTYQINFDKNRIKIQNIKKSFYVRGLKQIPSDAEITNAKLVRRVDGLYLYITCFENKVEKPQTNRTVGIDFGIAHHLNLSDGRVFDISLKENDAIKRLSKQVNRSLLRNGNIKSHNHFKRVRKLQMAYRKQNKKKYDKANKVVSTLLNDYDYIAIQDEMITNWHKGLFGKQVQSSCMGFIKAKLKRSNKVHVIPRSYPSTQVCPVCGALTKHPLSKRTYDCAHCGYHHVSRDIKSAQSILDHALVM